MKTKHLAARLKENAAPKFGVRNGINYRESKFQGMSIIEGVDSDGVRIIYALSWKEFDKKSKAWHDKGETNQHRIDDKYRKEVRKHLRGR